MVEQIMYIIGIGFLVAGLLVIGVIPLVHARAVRLTMRRLEALTPLSMAVCTRFAWLGASGSFE